MSQKRSHASTARDHSAFHKSRQEHNAACTWKEGAIVIFVGKVPWLFVVVQKGVSPDLQWFS